MTTESPHVAFREAYSYVLKYFEQVAKLLTDASVAMERGGFTMLRPSGDNLVGGLSPAVGRGNTWIANWLFTFYAPTAAFAGRRYGVAGTIARKIPFIGFGMHGTETDIPAAYLGWLEPIEPADDWVEKSVAQYFNAIDSTLLNPTPSPVTSVSEVHWAPASHCNQPLRVALAIVPLDRFTGPGVVEDLVDKLAAVVRGGSG